MRYAAKRHTYFHHTSQARVDVAFCNRQMSSIVGVSSVADLSDMGNLRAWACDSKEEAVISTYKSVERQA